MYVISWSRLGLINCDKSWPTLFLEQFLPWNKILKTTALWVKCQPETARKHWLTELSFLEINTYRELWKRVHIPPMRQRRFIIFTLPFLEADGFYSSSCSCRFLEWAASWERNEEEQHLAEIMFTKQILGKGIYYSNWRQELNLLGCMCTQKSS